MERGRAVKRRPAMFVVSGIAFAAGLAGCSLIVTFDDVPSKLDASTLPDSRPQNDVGVVDTGGEPDAGPLPEEDASAADASADYTNACTGKPDGKYCNGNQVIVDAGNKDDLVTCLAGKTVSAKLCTNGCQRMPTGYPDECNQCAGKATGLYCGDDFVGWHPMNKNTRIRCDNGAIVGNLICANVCSGTGPNASCQ